MNELKQNKTYLGVSYTASPGETLTRKKLIDRIFTNEKIRAEVKSAAITFIAVFLPTFALSVQGLQWESLELAGGSAALMVVLRLATKAAWEGFVALLVYLSVKLKK